MRKISKIKCILSCLFASVSIFAPLGAAALDPAQTILCSTSSGDGGISGKEVLQWNPSYTDTLHYNLDAKSTDAKTDGTDQTLNSILKLSGYHIGEENPKNIFEKMGLGGLKYSSYFGEWAYFYIDPCASGDKQSQLTDYGVYYLNRKSPLSTYNEAATSKDVRSQEVARGRLNAFFRAFFDNFSNAILAVAKFVLALTLAIISVSMGDIASWLGITGEVQQTFFSNLYHGVFLPLVTIFILFSVVWTVYQGIMKHQIRMAVTRGLIRPTVAFLLTVILGANPQLLSLPVNLSVLLQSTVIGAMSSSLDGRGTTDLCQTTLPTKNTDITSKTFLSDQADYTRALIGCRMWSEYLFKPIVKGQFGSDYKELEHLNNLNGAWVGNPTVTINKDTQIDNWGLFYVSVLSGSHTPQNGIYNTLINGVDRDYYRIIDTLSNYDETVDTSGDTGGDIEGASGGSSYAANVVASHYTSGDPHTSQMIGYVRNGITAEQLDGYLQSTGIHYDPNRINGELLLHWQDQTHIDVRYLIAFAQGESSLGTAGIASHGGNMIGMNATNENPSGAKKYSNETVAYNMMAKHLLKHKDFTLAIMDENSKLGEHCYYCNKGHETNAGKLRASIVAKVDTWINEHGGADETLTDIGLPQIADIETNIASEGGNSSDALTLGVPVPADNPVLKEFSYFVGDKQGERAGYALLTLLFTLLGCLAPLFFALFSAIYGVGLSLLMMICPVFFLFACFAGVGEQISSRFNGLFIATFIKRILCSLVMMFSILISTTTMDLIHQVGLFQALVFLVIASILLIAKRHEILDRVSRLNLNQSSLGNIMHQSLHKRKQDLKLVSSTLVGAGAGAVGAKVGGGSGLRGARAGAKRAFQNQLYQRPWGVRANSVAEVVRRSNTPDEATHTCIQCGVRLREGDTAFIGPEGLWYCEDCAASLGYKGMTMATTPDRDRGQSVTRDDKSRFETTVDKDGKEKEKMIRHATRADFARVARDLPLNDRSEKATEKFQQMILDSMAVTLSDEKKLKDSGATGEDAVYKNAFVPDPIKTMLPRQRVEEALDQMKEDNTFRVTKEKDGTQKIEKDYKGTEAYSDLFSQTWTDYYNKKIDAAKSAVGGVLDENGRSTDPTISTDDAKKNMQTIKHLEESKTDFQKKMDALTKMYRK